MKKATILCLPALALLALGGMGCGGREKTLCDKFITCEGGNDKDRNACVDRWIEQAQVSDAYKCSDSWNKYLECMDASAICQSGRLRSDSCSSQSQAWIACLNAASALGKK